MAERPSEAKATRTRGKRRKITKILSSLGSDHMKPLDSANVLFLRYKTQHLTLAVPRNNEMNIKKTT